MSKEARKRSIRRYPRTARDVSPFAGDETADANLGPPYSVETGSSFPSSAD